MTQDEMDRFYGRAMREEREARHRLECLKAKANEMVADLSKVAANFVHDVLEERLTEADLDGLPEKQDIARVCRDLVEADADLAVKMQRRADMER